MNGFVVPDLLRHAALRFPDKLCVSSSQGDLTFRQVSERASRLVSFLRRLGVSQGDRVAMLAANEPEFIEVRVGVQRAGAILVPLNYRLSAAELRAIAADCTPRVLIAGREYQQLGEMLGVDPILLLGGAESSYEAAVKAAEPAEWVTHVPATADSVISYTSGTTGRPKGAILSAWAMHAGMIAMGQEIGARPDATYLAAMPMFHIGSQVGYAFTYLGATSVLVPKFDAHAVLDAIETGKVTHMQLVPMMIRALLDISAGANFTGARLERILYGAAPMSPGLLREAFGPLQCEFVNGYGMTEALGISMLRPEDHDPLAAPQLLASVGKDGIGMVTRIVDESGKDVPAETVGEIVCQGPTVMRGYWNDPSATESSLVDGWLHTGDLGYRSADGYLYLVDRRQDLIITGGENVYPREVELVLIEHPDIADAAVVGVPDPYWGQVVSAAILPHPGRTIDPQDIDTHCRSRLAGYKVPRLIQLVDRIPKSPTGKTLRKEIRAWMAANER